MSEQPDEYQKKIEILTRKVERERAARKQAESLLEQKSLELYESNQALVKSHDELENRVHDRTEQLSDANRQLLREMAHREELNRRMLDLSHQAGKAEIATGVLHNVGNVLNSVNVSATMLDQLLSRFPIEMLAKSANILNEQSDLGDFFANDTRGKIFPQFLERITKSFRQEADAAHDEVASLIENIEHIKSIVAVQQLNAGVSGLVESVAISEVIEDSLLLAHSNIEKFGIVVSRDFEKLPHVMLEKQKLIQILVNLFKNASEAILQGGGDDRKLSIRLVAVGEQEFEIQVADNGIGIDSEKQNDIFTHGFTTKKDGRGFGLHTSANAAREMGGNLAVESDGPGKGATFRLSLPAKKASDVPDAGE